MDILGKRKTNRDEQLSFLIISRELCLKLTYSVEDFVN